MRGLLICCCLLMLTELAYSGETRTVIDPAGRSVRVPVHPSRVVALAPNLTEIAYAVGGGSQMVGRTRYADYPPEAERLEIVGTYVNLSMERIALLHPDLCLAVRDGTPLQAVQDLERLGIPVFSVTTDTLDEVVKAVQAVGDVLDRGQEGARVAAGMLHDLERIRARVARCSSHPRVFYQISIHPVISCGRGTHVDQLISLAGGINTAATAKGYPRFGAEQVLALNPEVVILTSMDRDTQMHEALQFWQQWPQVAAVAAGRVIPMDSDVLDRPTPRLIQGLEQLITVLHPELAEERP